MSPACRKYTCDRQPVPLGVQAGVTLLYEWMKRVAPMVDLLGVASVTQQPGLFPIIDPDRLRAGRRKMHALQRQIHRVWMATTQTDTSLHSVDAETV